MKKEVLGLTLTGALLMGAAACGQESAAEKHADVVAGATAWADELVNEAVSIYHKQYLPYLGQLGLKCVNTLNRLSQQDDADYNAGNNSFTKETAAALMVGDCSSNLTSVDRASIYKSYHAGVGDPLRDLIREGALEDGKLSANEIETYRAKLVTEYEKDDVTG